MDDLNQILKVLDEGAFITHEEMAALASEVRALRADAERYRWLVKYTSPFFMTTEKQINKQVDFAMGKRKL